MSAHSTELSDLTNPLAMWMPPVKTVYCRHPSMLLPSRQDCMQVLGHSKTMLVLLGGWAFLGDHVSLKQLCGMALAVIGMVLYGVASSQ